MIEIHNLKEFCSINASARGVTNTGNGERGTGNRERESGNECTAVILLRIQNGGRKHGNRVM